MVVDLSELGFIQSMFELQFHMFAKVDHRVFHQSKVEPIGIDVTHLMKFNQPSTILTVGRNSIALLMPELDKM